MDNLLLRSKFICKSRLIFNGVVNDLDEHNTNRFLLLEQKKRTKILWEGRYLKYFTHKKLWKLKLDVLCSFYSMKIFVCIAIFKKSLHT